MGVRRTTPDPLARGGRRQHRADHHCGVRVDRIRREHAGDLLDPLSERLAPERGLGVALDRIDIVGGETRQQLLREIRLFLRRGGSVRGLPSAAGGEQQHDERQETSHEWQKKGDGLSTIAQITITNPAFRRFRYRDA